jgi:hypothetical protein
MKKMRNEDLMVLAAMENMEGFRLISAEEAMAVNGGQSLMGGPGSFIDWILETGMSGPPSGWTGGFMGNETVSCCPEMLSPF